MNRRIVRNGLLALALSATAALLPAQRSEAQAYTCEDCMYAAASVLALCLQYTPDDNCSAAYYDNTQLCISHGFCPA